MSNKGGGGMCCGMHKKMSEVVSSVFQWKGSHMAGRPGQIVERPPVHCDWQSFLLNPDACLGAKLPSKEQIIKKNRMLNNGI